MCYAVLCGAVLRAICVLKSKKINPSKRRRNAKDILI